MEIIPMRKVLSLALAVMCMASVAFAIETPVFPGAKQLPSNDPMAIGIEMTKKQLKETAGANAKVEAYVLPTGTTLDKVASFYATSLKGYTEASKMATPTGGSASWHNGSNGTVSITLMNNTMKPDGSPYLVVAEASSATSTH